MLVVLTMHLAIRFSFEQGFLGYLQRSAEDRTEMIADVVAEQYADYGSWYFLRNNQRGFMQALRALDTDRHMEHMGAAGKCVSGCWMRMTAACSGTARSLRRTLPQTGKIQ